MNLFLYLTIGFNILFENRLREKNSPVWDYKFGLCPINSTTCFNEFRIRLGNQVSLEVASPQGVKMEMSTKM